MKRRDRYINELQRIAEDDLQNTLEPYKTWLRVIPLIDFIGNIEHKDVLDLGCGDGDVLTRLKCNKAVGIDASRAYCDKLIREGYVAYCDDIEVADLFTFGKFDIVILSMVLEHVLDPHRLIKSVSEVLFTADSKVYVVVPYKEDIAEAFKDTKYEFAHLRSFDLPTLDKMMVGFERTRHRIIVPRNPYIKGNVILRKLFSLGKVTFPQLWNTMFVKKYGGEVLLAEYALERTQMAQVERKAVVVG